MGIIKFFPFIFNRLKTNTITVPRKGGGGQHWEKKGELLRRAPLTKYSSLMFYM
jgi:hypothetical protein